MENMLVQEVAVDQISAARKRLEGVIRHTPLEFNDYLSERYQCRVFLKREDLQHGRSYKIRGAGNFLRATPREQLENGIVAASAGNHAQGVAIGCTQLKIRGTIFMPTTTPQQKIQKVRKYGGAYIDVVLTGDSFDDAYQTAIAFCHENKRLFVHPFDHPKIIEGQGTIAAEILEDTPEPIDYLFCALGGGGMVSGVSTYFKAISPYTKIIAAEPLGAPSMTEALKAGHPVQLQKMDRFVDGAAVGKVGELTFSIAKKNLSDIVLVPEGMACTTIMTLYNQDAIVVEPAGALPISALEFYKEKIINKTVVCIVGGSNNDIERMAEIKERSMIFEGLLHYFVVNLPSRPGSMAEFLMNVITPKIDVIRLEHQKKSNKETGNSLIGVQLERKEDYEFLIERMKNANIKYSEIDKDPELYYYFLK